MLNDLFQFDPVGAVWSELSAAVGVSPSARASFGFAAVGGSLYLFGGYDGKGEKQQSLFDSCKARIDLVWYVTSRKHERLLFFQLVNKRMASNRTNRKRHVSRRFSAKCAKLTWNDISRK